LIRIGFERVYFSMRFVAHLLGIGSGAASSHGSIGVDETRLSFEECIKTPDIEASLVLGL
jgi:hypothetical protein